MSRLQAPPLTLEESYDEHLRRVGLAAHDQGLHEARVLLHMARGCSKISSSRALRHSGSISKTSNGGYHMPRLVCRIVPRSRTVRTVRL